MPMTAPSRERSAGAGRRASPSGSSRGSRTFSDMFLSLWKAPSGADWGCDRERFLAVPRRDDRPETARWTAGCNHQQIVGRAQGAVDALLVLTSSDRPFPDGAPFLARNAS